MNSLSFLSIDWIPVKRVPVTKYIYRGLPSKSGVYLIAFVRGDDLSTLIPAYIGSSVNIYSRILAHHKINEILENVPEGYEPIIFYCLLDSDISDIEKQLILSCSPKFNTAHNSNDYNEVNCPNEEYNRFLSELKTVMDGRKKVWLADKLSISEWEISIKLRKRPHYRREYFTKKEVETINSIFKSSLKINTVENSELISV